MRRGDLKRRALQTRAMVRELESRGAQVSWRRLDYGNVQLIVYSPRWGMATYEARSLRRCLFGAL
jgi:hypothetical protein